ncbi:MAG: flagellar hook-basal body complex protein FliE [Kiritimatiellae bacterium]|nr:flagellar hook-basal body complex protein FliE [Kiritimatiellia bacterium]
MNLDPIQSKIRELAREQEALAAEKTPSVGTGAAGRTSFEDVLGQMVDDLDSMQKTAGSTIQELAGEEGAAAGDVAKKMQEADAAYELMMQIRHKLVDVYSAVEQHNEKT